MPDINLLTRLSELDLHVSFCAIVPAFINLREILLSHIATPQRYDPFRKIYCNSYQIIITSLSLAPQTSMGPTKALFSRSILCVCLVCGVVPIFYPLFNIYRPVACSLLMGSLLRCQLIQYSCKSSMESIRVPSFPRLHINSFWHLPPSADLLPAGTITYLPPNQAIQIALPVLSGIGAPVRFSLSRFIRSLIAFLVYLQHPIHLHGVRSFLYLEDSLLRTTFL